MNTFKAFAEACVRESLARPESERRAAAFPFAPAKPLELQLMGAIDSLDRLASKQHVRRSARCERRPQTFSGA